MIATVVIGGTSIAGGRGSVLGTVRGALLVQAVASGVTQLGWRSELSDLFVGVATLSRSAPTHPGAGEEDADHSDCRRARSKLGRKTTGRRLAYP